MTLHGRLGKREWTGAGCTILLLVFVWQAMPRAATGNGDEGTFQVSVFDCYMPVPSDFVLNTHEKEYIALFLRSDFESRRLAIREYRGNLEDTLVEVGTRNVDGLTVEEFRFRRATGNNNIDRVFRIHNGVQEVTIYGPTEEFVDSLVDGCLSNKRPVLR